MTLILQYDARHRDILLIMRLTEKKLCLYQRNCQYIKPIAI